MPQMAPLNWLTLFLFFSISFLTFNSINYFSFWYINSIKQVKVTKISTNWKW
uniref:ATP synthase complex subunit 8 n=1 Tax=Callipogon relictus TaxID=1105317 RepID=A0A343VZ26_9CUCU|nr:ATP synthase F0 subunit 8 [Callipogon relictus]AVR43547.1 ATP synthase F0 subunit 8 [Callipogon relictus]WDD39335.1 ATP synthase F0 subunit 8 [Callipogon relictus]